MMNQKRTNKRLSRGKGEKLSGLRLSLEDAVRQDAQIKVIGVGGAIGCIVGGYIADKIG